MTISSSMSAGLAGLTSNAARLAGISDNIANSGTHGYRRVETQFSSMVLSSSAAGSYAAGGVRNTTHRLIDQSGPMINTQNSTDLAVNGRGFLPVTTITALGSGAGTLPLMLTGTGSFRPDAEGILRTASGLVLLGWPADANGNIGAFPRDAMGGLEPVTVQAGAFTGNPTSLVTMAVNLPATATRPEADGEPYALSVEYFSNLGTPETINILFEPTLDPATSTNTWTMSFTNPRNANAVIGEYTVNFNAASTNGGTLADVTRTAAGLGGNYDPATGRFALDLGDQVIEVQVGTPGSSSGLTQLASSFVPVSITKNGSATGNLVSVNVDENGFVRSINDQGFSRVIYQIPLINVPNQNGLRSLDSQTYQISQASGPFFLWNAGDGPTGGITGFALQESAADVAAELTQLIRTQRAYSSNAKVIQTADEMLQETTNIKR